MSDELSETAAKLEENGLSPHIADAFARCASQPIPRRERRGLEALAYFALHGVEMIPYLPSGKAIAKWDADPTPWTRDPQVVANLWNGFGDVAGRGWGTPIERFMFLPERAGLVGLDIDRGHADGVDGLEQFYATFGRGSLPTIIRNLEIGSHPCFASTPRGGFHVYFRHDGPSLKPCILCPGCEIKTGRTGLVAPGSEKGGRPYTLFGRFQDVPPLPPFLAAAIAAKNAPRPLPSRPARVAPWGRQKGGIGLDKLAGEAVATMGGRHHDSQLNLASRGRRCGYDASEILSYIEGRPDVFGVGKDTGSTVASVFKK
jgi:hypothetical protein